MTQTTDDRPDGWPRDPWTAAAADGRPTDGSDAAPAEQSEQPEQNRPDEQADADAQGEPAPVSQPVAPEQQHTQQIPPPAAEQTQPYAYGQQYGQQYGQNGDPYGQQYGSGQQQGYQQYGYYAQPGQQQSTGYPYGTGHGPAGQPPQPPAGGAFTQPREPRRGPGWFGVATVGVGSALVASLLTAGLVNQNADTTTTSTGSSAPSSSAAPQQPGPVTSSNLKSPDWGAVAAAVEPSVVAVKVAGQGGSGEGSGVILNTNGNVLTNNHVVAEASGGGQIEVVLSDGRGYKAEIVGTDPQTDLAVIKISSPPSGLKPATLGDSTAVRVGDAVMAVGNPLGLSDTVTTGIVSAVDRPVTTGGQSQTGSDTVFTNAIQTDAAINPGNSGGALVDGQGRLIGINSSIASLGSGSVGSQSGNIGLGFAIPVNEAKVVADQLLKNGKVAHAYLGVNLQDGTVTLDGAQRQTAEIGQVNDNTPAATAGLKAGDQVIAIDGDQVAGADYLIAQVRERRPGQEITLTVVRGGSKQDVKLTLGTRPGD